MWNLLVHLIKRSISLNIGSFLLMLLVDVSQDVTITSCELWLWSSNVPVEGHFFSGWYLMINGNGYGDVTISVSAQVFRRGRPSLQRGMKDVSSFPLYQPTTLACRSDLNASWKGTDVLQLGFSDKQEWWWLDGKLYDWTLACFYLLSPWFSVLVLWLIMNCEVLFCVNGHKTQ